MEREYWVFQAVWNTTWRQAWDYQYTEKELLSLWFEEVKRKDTAYNGLYVWEESNINHYYVDLDYSIRWASDWSNILMSFPEKQHAEKRAKKLKALKAVRKRHAENDGDFVPDWNDDDQKKCFLYFDYEYKERDVWDWFMLSLYLFLPYFSTQGKGRQCREDLWDILDDLL